MTKSRVEAFLELLQTQPDDAMIWYGLANEYIKIDKVSDAIEALRNVIRITPDNTAAYQMLGSVLMGTGQRDEARRIWQQGIEAANRTGAGNARRHIERLLASSENPDQGF